MSPQIVTGVRTGWMFDSVACSQQLGYVLYQQAHNRRCRSNKAHERMIRWCVPSIKHSFTISHSRFISCSGRYLHCLADSSHSSGPAPLDKRAGPGIGTSLSGFAIIEDNETLLDQRKDL